MASRIFSRVLTVSTAAAVAVVSLAALPAGFAQTLGGSGVDAGMATHNLGYSYDMIVAADSSSARSSADENGKWQKFGIISSLGLLGYASLDHHAGASSSLEGTSSQTRTSVQRRPGSLLLPSNSAAGGLNAAGVTGAAGITLAAKEAAKARHNRNSLSIFSRADGTTLFSAGIGAAGIASHLPSRGGGAGTGSISHAFTTDRAAGPKNGSSLAPGLSSGASLAPVPEPGFASFAALFVAALGGLLFLRKRRIA